MLRKLTLTLVLCLALVLTGCKKAPADTAAEAAAEATEVTVPATTPADGDPNAVTCQGTYYVSDAEITAAADTVVAEMDGANLTNSQLQIYYWMEVAAYRQANHDIEPDFTQRLDTQACPIDDSVNSWQQYFLKKALASWHARQALVFMSRDTGTPEGMYYEPDLEKRAEYMTGMPAAEYLFQWADGYKPNRLHQAYLDNIPEMLDTLAADNGFHDNDAQAMAIAGAGASGRVLISYAQTANYAYMYFTEMGYHFEPTQEEIEAYYAEHMSDAQIEEGKTIDFRHILLIPENAQVSADGTVTASEDAWNQCMAQAGNLADKWQTAVKKTRYSQFSHVSVSESRFSETAKNHSQDPGSSANGGLYVNVSKGQLLPELDAWCFDAARQKEDYEIIRTSAGVHIVFFSASHENWYTAAKDGLTAHLYETLVRDAMSQYPMTADFGAIRLGVAPDNGSFVTVDHLLYPDIAHERFPDVPLYLQQDYPNAPFGNYLVSTHGCGITTLSMIASYMADDELTPAELAGRYGYYCGPRGSEIVMFDDTPAEMGFHLKKRSYSWSEIDEALRNGQIVVSLQYYGYWTRGGHYLAMIGLTDEGRYVVRDSNLLNYKRIANHLKDSHSRGSISEAGQYYWIYEKKVTSIPSCSRCGTGAEGAPEVMFLSEYTCGKCLTATQRRSDFLCGTAG